MNPIHQPARRRLAALSLGVALGTGLALPALAMPGDGPRHGMSMAHSAAGPEGPMFGGMLMRLLDRVGATPQQRAQIEQIVKSGTDEMRARRESARALREQTMALFAQPTVDANALEALRQQQLALHDAATRRMSSTLLEISRVLTPEQRKQMADHMAQRREMMQRHQRERQNLDPAKS